MKQFLLAKTKLNAVAKVVVFETKHYSLSTRKFHKTPKMYQKTCIEFITSPLPPSFKSQKCLDQHRLIKKKEERAQNKNPPGRKGFKLRLHEKRCRFS